MSNHIKWSDTAFTSGWVYYLVDIGLATPDDKRRLTGLMVNDPIVHTYAVDKAVEYPEHFQAFLTKRKLLGDNYEPER